jgi:MFS transporter, ACS family, hexuronate transporter
LAPLPQGNRWKWGITFVLFLATVLTYLDRQTVSLCGPIISAELHLNNEEFGRLLASFRWAYAFVHVPAGFLVDRIPVRAIYAFAVGLWSLAGAGAAFTTTVRQLMATRAVLGVGEAFNWPCATRIVANMLSPSARGLGSGIFNSGAAVGSLLAPLVITPIAIHYGWRWAFFVIGSMGACWIGLWMFRTRKGTPAFLMASSVAVSDAEHGINKQGVKGVFRHPAFWMLVTVAVTINPCWYFLNEWIPKYMHDQRGMGYLAAGLVTIPIFLGADFGNLASGGLIKRLTGRSWTLPKARGFTLTLATLLIFPVAFLTSVQSAAIGISLMAMAAIGITSIVANYTACQQDFSFANVGLVAGILGMSSNVFSALVDPMIGRYVDRTGNYALIFILVALLPAVSLAAILIFDRLIHGRNNYPR